MKLHEALQYRKPTRRTGWVNWCRFEFSSFIWDTPIRAFWLDTWEEVELTLSDIMAADWEIEGQ